MPAAYEAMRDKFQRKGMPKKAAQSKAARIYNASRHGQTLQAHREKKAREGLRRAFPED